VENLTFTIRKIEPRKKYGLVWEIKINENTEFYKHKTRGKIVNQRVRQNCLARISSISMLIKWQFEESLGFLTLPNRDG